MIRILPLVIFGIILIILVVQFALVPLYSRIRRREEAIKDGIKKVEGEVSKEKDNKSKAK